MCVCIALSGFPRTGAGGGVYFIRGLPRTGAGRGVFGQSCVPSRCRGVVYSSWWFFWRCRVCVCVCVYSLG